MSEYLWDNQPVSHDRFVRRALDPGASAVVDACAGSGKTWLLVGRIVRLLLAGTPAEQILAITFTRRAAQEMRKRLLEDLEVLARAESTQVLAALEQRGLSAEQAHQALPPARELHERVASAEPGVSIETFHGWFWRLLRRAPLASDVPHSASLIEAPGRLLQEAWNDFAGELLQVEQADTGPLSDYEELVSRIGDANTEKLLRGFVDKRAEWWSFGGPDGARAIERASEPMREALRIAGFAQTHHPGEALRKRAFLDLIEALLERWETAPRQTHAEKAAIHKARAFLQASPEPARDVRLASLVLLSDKGEPLKRLQPKEGTRSGDATLHFDELFARAAQALQAVREAEQEWDAIRLNECGLRCGQRLVHAYERRKREANVLDFTDIEWHADRLLRDEATAAYMQANLDARYRHLLVDEFQDTSALQWRALRCWLDAYEGDSQQPTVFVVGDPKQSIYRFRRAEPRVFEAARIYLAQKFAAATLRTNVTRRVPPQLVATLDSVFTGHNRLYQQHSSHAHANGGFVLLPLARSAADASAAPRNAASATREPALRDVLRDGRAEPRNDRYEREGSMLAAEIAHWVASVRVTEGGNERRATWSDVLVLMRQRTHMAELERAFRQAGIPTLADRKGGLLAQPEIEDLRALLQFLCSEDDLSLAHALRSPVFGCTDRDLVAIADASTDAWWHGLSTIVGCGLELARARALLAGWRQDAGVLPVHDLLDRIFDQADVRARYAQCVPRERGVQVQANFDAFLELALTLDAGRFPTLTRFLDELQWMRDRDAQTLDEGLAASDDAVRLMTVHGAKGLEAPIVAIADTCAIDDRPDDYQVLLNWPPQLPEPEHFSLVGRPSRSGSGRRAWLQADREQRIQEDWNLLYVAMTRAQQVLIVSASDRNRSARARSWYERLSAGVPSETAAASPRSLAPPAGGRERDLSDFRPQPLPTGRRLAAGESDAIRMGKAWHALLEHPTQPHAPQQAERICAEFALDAQQAREVVQAAQRVTTAPALRPFFGPGARAWNELELIDAGGQSLRIDRLVELGDTVWILDYKWRCTDSERAGYERQLVRYAAAVEHVRPARPIRTALVLADGSLVETALPAAADKIGSGGPPRIEAP